jgi:hypothetical protein
MDLVSWQGRGDRKFAGFLFLLIAFSSVFSGAAHAQTQISHVKVTLRIAFIIKDSDAAPHTLEISIPRQGTSQDGSQLKEIKALIEQGKLNDNQTSPDFILQDHILIRRNTDFELTGTPHNIVVIAEGLEQISPKELTDEQLRLAFSREDRILSITVVLQKPAGSPSPSVSPSPSPGGAGGDTNFSIKPLLSRLKNMFWVLGLFGFCAVGLWVCLVLLAKFRGKDSMEQWLLRLPSWVAQGLIWPFGFGLRHSLVSNTETQTPSTLLENIDQSLSRLCQSNPAITDRAYIQSITNNLARLADPNFSVSTIKGSLDGIATSLEQLSKKPATTGVEKPETVSHTPALRKMMDEALVEFKRNLLKEFKPDLLNSTQASVMNTKGVVAPLIDTSQVGIDSNAQQKARVLYQKLLDQQPLDCKPVFLEADTKSSILGKFADPNVYLLQVPSPQAPFVLFTDDSDDGTVGWVFPNTARGFDRSTLRDVFPSLNEAQFNEAREIEPVIVSKAGERRWKVDRESGFFGA